jgi:hypothetical protein
MSDLAFSAGGDGAGRSPKQLTTFASFRRPAIVATSLQSHRPSNTRSSRIPDRQEHVNFSRRELTIVFLVVFDVRCLDIVEYEIPAFLIAEFGHPLEKIRIVWGVSRLHTDKADTQHRLLLRARRERPRRRAAEQRHELASLHVWMAPAWQEITSRAAQKSLAVMCPACSRSPEDCWP